MVDHIGKMRCARPRARAVLGCNRDAVNVGPASPAAAGATTHPLLPGTVCYDRGVKEDLRVKVRPVRRGSTDTASPASLALRDAAGARPQDVALRVDEQSVTFAELNSQADGLAQQLVEHAGAGDRIALRATGTHAAAVGFVAIQRAGMVSVPVDPTAPPTACARSSPTSRPTCY